MKSYELKPTEKNLTKTFLDDSIERDTDIIRFAKILDALNDSCSIALDGGWGSGKTFFVKQTKLLLDSFNEWVLTGKPEIKQKVIAKCKKQMEPVTFQPQVCVYYDAWENDNDDDPVLSLVYSIVNTMNVDFKLSSNLKFPKIAAFIMELFTEKDWNKLISILKDDSALSQIKAEKKAEELIAEFLDDLLCERGERLVVFIDELDRCKPSYAVHMLERIKHYFENERITFVFSINTNELQHTIKQYYGEEFDACRYLDRFFDLRISLPPLNLERYYKLLHFNNSYYTYDEVCDAVIKTFHFEMREISRFIHINQIAADKIAHSTGSRFLPRDASYQFSLSFALPIMIGLKMTDMQRYTNFIRGKDISPLLDVYCSSNFSHCFCAPLLTVKESFEEKPGKKTVTLEEKLKEVYNALFVVTYDNVLYEINIGSYSFNQETRDLLIKTASLLSKYTSTNFDNNDEQ